MDLKFVFGILENMLKPSFQLISSPTNNICCETPVIIGRILKGRERRIRIGFSACATNPGLDLILVHNLVGSDSQTSQG